MNFLIERFPSRNEQFLVFCACVFPIHFWITLVLLYKFPSLILKANIFQIFGVFAYTYVFTFIESLCLFVILLFFFVFLPIKRFRDHFVHRGTALALSIVLFALIINIWILVESDWVLFIPGLLLIFIVFYIWRLPKESVVMKSIAERLTVISVLFLFIDMLSLGFIVLRQI